MTSKAVGALTDDVAQHVPSPVRQLLDDRFVRSCELIDEYILGCATNVFSALGLDAACCAPTTVREAIDQCGLEPTVAPVPVKWLFELLADRGLIRRLEGERFQGPGALPPVNTQALVDMQAQVAPESLPSFRIAALAAELYPSVLRGQVTGEQGLFGPETFDAWCSYFSNDNALYGISNSIAALAVEHYARADDVVFEIGGGLGSAAEALLHSFCARNKRPRYLFSEISAMFLRRAQRRLRPMFPDWDLNFANADIDRNFPSEFISPRSCDVIYGVNVLHVAKDLGATLHRIREALTAEGSLIVGECVRPFANQPIYVEFVFNLLGSFRAPILHPVWRPTGGFLTPEQWTAALMANGFKDIEIYPDIAAIRNDVPGFVAAAICARPA